MGKRAKTKDSDYRRKKNFQFTKKDYVRPPTETGIALLREVERIDNLKNRSHPIDKADLYTKYTYKKKKQGLFKNIGGSRGIGLFVTEPIPMGKIAFVSEEPGIQMTLDLRAEYKSDGYHFIGRNMYPKSSHVMKANVVAMKDEDNAEIPNAKLLSISKEVLVVDHNILVKKEGMYAAIRATCDIPKNTFILLEGYDNTKDYPYGNPSYLAIEKEVIGIYMQNFREKMILGARYQVCKECCCLYANNKSGHFNEHITQCEGNLLARRWLLREE